MRQLLSPLDNVRGPQARATSDSGRVLRAQAVSAAAAAAVAARKVPPQMVVLQQRTPSHARPGDGPQAARAPIRPLRIPRPTRTRHRGRPPRRRPMRGASALGSGRRHRPPSRSGYPPPRPFPYPKNGGPPRTADGRADSSGPRRRRRQSGGRRGWGPRGRSTPRTGSAGDLGIWENEKARSQEERALAVGEAERAERTSVVGVVLPPHERVVRGGPCRGEKGQ